MRRWRRAFAALIAFGTAGAVSAQVGRDVTLEEASILAEGCVNCHGPAGAGMPPVPGIAGLPADRFIALMTDLRSDLVPGATIMQRIALGYDDSEIAALARYFAGGWTAGAP
jgi:sulfide dehydrogenase cytochrome subunit